MKYELIYNYWAIAEVEVEAHALPAIKQMVEFWTGWESRLAENGKDYVQTWLKQLARFLLRNDRLPQNDEGWISLDGTQGIQLLNVDLYEFQDDEIEIRSK